MYLAHLLSHAGFPPAHQTERVHNCSFFLAIHCRRHFYHNPPTVGRANDAARAARQARLHRARGGRRRPPKRLGSALRDPLVCIRYRGYPISPDIRSPRISDTAGTRYPEPTGYRSQLQRKSMVSNTARSEHVNHRAQQLGTKPR